MDDNNRQNCVEQAKRGDAKAIAELYQYYWRAARATAYGVTADINMAEDAASEAFYAALGSLQDLKDTQRFGPWLRTIVIRTAKHLAAARSKEKNLENQFNVQSPTPESDLEQRELAALIHEAVGMLSESLREAVSLFYFEGYHLKEAAYFLDVPEGTLKRRLHEARLRLRDAAEQIVKGTKPMNPQREQILKKVEDALSEGIHSETFFQAMRQALHLRPVPNELIRKVMRKIYAEKKEKYDTISPEKEKKWREMMALIYSHSERAQDPNHPVGKVSNEIRAELSEFKPWQLDWSKIGMSRVVRSIFEENEKTSLPLLPPDFTKGSHGAYISATRSFLLLDEDGSVCTSYELMQKNASMDAFKKKIHQGKRLSDALSLLWKEPETIELKAVEDLLRRLSKAIIPVKPIHFSTYEEPHYRVALRMQIDDNPIPAVIAGVLNPRPEIYGDGHIASAIIYLEPWAEAQSGQTIELSDFSPLTDLLPKKPNFEDKKI
jgi:RNA polymerase sigma-70 factor (ECF subfamily)